LVRMMAKVGLTARQESPVVVKRERSERVIPLVDQQWRSVLLLQRKRSRQNELVGRTKKQTVD